MAYVTVPKDLTKVKSKVVFGLTKRQLICFGGALLVGVPLFFLIRAASRPARRRSLWCSPCCRAFCWRFTKNTASPLKWWYARS